MIFNQDYIIWLLSSTCSKYSARGIVVSYYITFGLYYTVKPKINALGDLELYIKVPLSPNMTLAFVSLLHNTLLQNTNNLFRLYCS